MPEITVLVNKPVKLKDEAPRIQLKQPLAYDNAWSHAVQVTVLNDDGTPADLSGIGVAGSFLKADQSTVHPIIGTVTENTARIILPPSCYTVPGRFKLTLNLTQPTPATGVDDFDSETDYAQYDMVVYQGTVYRFTEDHDAGAWTGEDAEASFSIRTALWVEGTVERNVSDTIVDPGTPVGNITQVIESASTAATNAQTAAAAASTLVEELSAFEIASLSEAKTYLGIT